MADYVTIDGRSHRVTVADATYYTVAVLREDQFDRIREIVREELDKRLGRDNS